MDISSLLGGGGAAGGGPSSSATASNSFGSTGLNENTLVIVGLALFALVALVLATRKNN